MITCPILNPIRFYDTVPDYAATFPNMDNITQRVMYVDGLQPGMYYKEFLYGKPLYLQFEFIGGTDDTTLSIYKWDIATESYILNSSSIAVNITPAGWEGNNFCSHTLNLAEGTYYLKFSDNYTSDVFVVTNSLTQRKKLIEVVYTHSENDFGAILDGHTFTNYFAGQLVLGNPENEISGFESDRGNLIKLNSTPKRIATLQINDIHYSYVDHINMIFSCDNLTINGVTYQNNEPPTSEDSAEFSDLKNITVKLVQTGNYYKYLRS